MSPVDVSPRPLITPNNELTTNTLTHSAACQQVRARAQEHCKTPSAKTRAVQRIGALVRHRGAVSGKRSEGKRKETHTHSLSLSTQTGRRTLVDISLSYSGFSHHFAKEETKELRQLRTIEQISQLTGYQPIGSR